MQNARRDELNKVKKNIYMQKYKYTMRDSTLAFLFMYRQCRLFNGQLCDELYFPILLTSINHCLEARFCPLLTLGWGVSLPPLSQLNRSAAPQTECRLVEPDMSADFQGLSATLCVCARVRVLSAWKMKNAVSWHSVVRRLACVVGERPV